MMNGIKRNTYLVDFNAIENKSGAGLIGNQPLNSFEKEVYCAMSSKPILYQEIENQHIENMLRVLTPKQKFVIEKKLEGYTQQEIADRMGINRRNVVKHINLIKNKLRKLLFNKKES